MTRSVALLACMLGLVACKGAKSPSGGTGSSGSATCGQIVSDLTAFSEVLENASADAKVRSGSYAGVLELLLDFEGASADLDGDLAALDVKSSDIDKTRASLAKSIQFAKNARGEIEQHAKDIAPYAKETQQAWGALRAICEGKGKAPDCGGVREAIAKFDAAESSDAHDKAIAALGAVKVTTPAVLKARDRATTASKAVQTAIKARSDTTEQMPQKWMDVQKDLSTSVDGLVNSCKDDARDPTTAALVTAPKPDPRKLTVLLQVKPTAGVEKGLLSLAAAAKDEDEKAFYKARAEGAFGSGFFLVKKDAHGNTEVLVVTNRHVVDLGDRATMELADGTSLGPAEIVYADPAYDLAVLRPATKPQLQDGGFAFAELPAKDQQTVIATGFPGMIGRPSYQTTKGYVSNESFRLDEEGMRPLTYVQHTAPIDPGSSGGPLTDEAGKILGVNTLKVTGREGVGLAVPSKYVLSTLQTAAGLEAQHASAPVRAKDARLACLGFIAELGVPDPRMLVLEQMISNHFVGTDGLDAAGSLANEDGFEDLWNDDSVRAMRIATLVKVRNLVANGGGPSVLETCDDVDPAAQKDAVKYKIRLANFETRTLALRWEQGRWKIDGFDAKGGSGKVTPKKLPPPNAAPHPGSGPKNIAPPKKHA